MKHAARSHGRSTPARLLAAATALLVVANLIAACAAAAPALVGRPWKLVAVGGQPPVADGQITFTADGQASFQTGCNMGGGSYRVLAANIDFGATMMTEMACDGPRGAQEQRFVAVIESDPTFIVTGDRLTLGSGSDSLTFVRA